MSGIAYLNDRYLPEADASVSMLDRSVLFADSVYEVIAVVGGHALDMDAHLTRLDRSLGELRIAPPRTPAEIGEICTQLVERNTLDEGKIYLQISRGTAERDFPFPADTTPTLFAYARKLALLKDPVASMGLRISTVRDLRWARRDIKTTMLLPSVLARQSAVDQGADDAWFVEHGKITEGSASNAYLVRNGVVHTHPLSHAILPGCTRARVLQLAAGASIEICEEAFSPEIAYAADEAFVTSATSFVTPVIQIDGHAIGTGTPGPITHQLRDLYLEFAKRGGARSEPGE